MNASRRRWSGYGIAGGRVRRRWSSSVLDDFYRIKNSRVMDEEHVENVKETGVYELVDDPRE